MKGGCVTCVTVATAIIQYSFRGCPGTLSSLRGSNTKASPLLGGRESERGREGERERGKGEREREGDDRF